MKDKYLLNSVALRALGLEDFSSVSGVSHFGFVYRHKMNSPLVLILCSFAKSEVFFDSLEWCMPKKRPHDEGQMEELRVRERVFVRVECTRPSVCYVLCVHTVYAVGVTQNVYGCLVWLSRYLAVLISVFELSVVCRSNVSWRRQSELQRFGKQNKLSVRTTTGWGKKNRTK